MKRIICYLFFLFSVSITVNAQNNADKVTGVWLNEEKDAKVEVYESNGKYFGKLIWGKDLVLADGSFRKDDKNPDKKLKSRALLNLVMVSNLSFDGKEWSGGTIYDPKSGNSYSCTMKLDGKTLHLRGYKGISLLGRTTVWTRPD